MTTPMGPPPAAAPAGRDRTELWGWLGIVLGLCCGVLGVIFGVLSIQDARRYGRSTVLGWVAIAIGVLNMLSGAIFGIANN